MLRTCKIVTRGTATGLFFKAIGCQTKTAAWHDALRARGVRVSPHHFFDVKRTTAENASLFVRTVGVDRIVEALVHSARIRQQGEIGPDEFQRRLSAKITKTLARTTVRYDADGLARITQTVERAAVRAMTYMSDENEALYGVPPEVVPFANNGHVLADKLCSLGHWVGESYSLWVNRPKGTSRAKWQRAAALQFVQALPVPADMYALRHEHTKPGMTQVGPGHIRISDRPAPTPTVNVIARVVGRMLPHGTRDALVLARAVEDAMQELYSCTFMFKMHAFSDTEWGVSFDGYLSSQTFRVLAPLHEDDARSSLSLVPRVG
jgi:hypothetical protein